MNEMSEEHQELVVFFHLTSFDVVFESLFAVA